MSIITLGYARPFYERALAKIFPQVTGHSFSGERHRLDASGSMAKEFKAVAPTSIPTQNFDG